MDMVETGSSEGCGRSNAVCRSARARLCAEEIGRRRHARLRSVWLQWIYYLGPFRSAESERAWAFRTSRAVFGHGNRFPYNLLRDFGARICTHERRNDQL